MESNLSSGSRRLGYGHDVADLPFPDPSLRAGPQALRPWTTAAVPAPHSEIEQALSARPRVVIVNGPAGVGKTTTARSLAALARSAACVHGDDLRGFIVRRDAPVATGLGYRNGATVAGNFIAGGYDLVVLDTSDREIRAVAAEVCLRACAGSGLIHPGANAEPGFRGVRIDGGP